MNSVLLMMQDLPEGRSFRVAGRRTGADTGRMRGLRGLSIPFTGTKKGTVILDDYSLCKTSSDLNQDAAPSVSGVCAAASAAAAACSAAISSAVFSLQVTLMDTTPLLQLKL